MLELSCRKGIMTWKIVYYGPVLSGKTTNLQTLRDIMPEPQRGHMMQAETNRDRVLSFDLLPVNYRTGTGAKLKIQLFTMPGQAQSDSSLKYLLSGADGVVFVADSQKSQTLHNSESFAGLEENFYQMGVNFEEAPLVVQFNKRDLATEIIQSESAVLSKWERPAVPVYFASALYGQGVRETLYAIIWEVCRSLRKQDKIQERFGVSGDEIISYLNRDRANGNREKIADAAGTGLGTRQ